MVDHDTFNSYWSADRTTPSPDLPDRVGLTHLTPAAILRLRSTLINADNYMSMIGWRHVSREEDKAVYADLSRRLKESRQELIRRARRDRAAFQLDVTSWDDPRLDQLKDVITSRLDLPTFIARQVGTTTVGFRRVDDCLVCPCPMPTDTGVDAWLFVDPVHQTCECTNCCLSGDVFGFAFGYLKLRHVALYNFLAVEAGLAPPLQPYAFPQE